VVIANNVDEKAFSTAFLEADHAAIPVVHVGKVRRSAAGPVLQGSWSDARIDRVRSRSVIAQTKTDDVVLVAARTSTAFGSDRASTTMVRAWRPCSNSSVDGKSLLVRNAVRFAFWGGEEEWLVGSTSYVKSPDLESL
jgi:hypothetical protein